MVTIDKSHCKLGAKGGDDIQLSPEQRQTCTKLSLRRNYIADADTMLDNFTALTWLCLSANALTKVPHVLENLQHLKHLYLSNNKIRVIEHLGNCKDLETLEVRHNQVEKVSGISHLSKLCTLSLSSNKLTEISSTEIPSSLEFLGLFGNKLTDFQSILSITTNMTNLIKLFIGSNPFCNSLPLKDTFNVSVSYCQQSNGVKRAKCEEQTLDLQQLLDVLRQHCTSLQNVDNNVLH